MIPAEMFDIELKSTEQPSEAAFDGPVFIIGMPRSGTKLVRGLLNQHSSIAIPISETEFLPWIVANHASFGDLSSRGSFSQFYRAISTTNYFDKMRLEGCAISEAEWFDACNSYCPAELFETLIRHDTQTPRDSNRIWGDKSPSYMGHLPLLRQLFPNSRVIYLVRDVRDHCLSMNQAWGKNILRAAQRWMDASQSVEDSRALYGNDLLQVRYEDLLGDSIAMLQRICQFLGVPYEKSMNSLNASVENLGDAVGYKGVKRDNVSKYLKEMPPATRQKIESLCWPMLERFDYPFEYKGPVERLSGLHMRALQVMDSLSLARFHLAEHGPRKGIFVLWGLYSKSGNRHTS